jgi:hypothetical protein
MKREPVPPSNERDKWLKRLMPRATTAAGPCLDTETFAAWADGALGGKALAAAEQHVSECSRCLAMAAAMQRTMPEPAQPASERRALWRWIVPLTAAATAVAIWIAVPQLHSPRPERALTRNAVQERESVVLPPADAPTPPPAAPPAGASVRAPEASPAPKPASEQGLRQGMSMGSPDTRNDADEERFRKEADLKRDENVPASPAELHESVAIPQSPDPTAKAETPAPAPPAAVDTLADSVASLRSTAKIVVIEAATPDRRIRWRVTGGTTIERTTDAGQTWIKTSSPAPAVVSITDVDARRATVTVSDGRTFTTADGGATWAVQEKPAAPF